MKIPDELRKDLNDHFSSLSIVSDLVGPPDRISVEFPDGNIYDVSVEDVAKHLIELGYRKVTTCEKCKAWPSDNDMSNMKGDDGADRRWCIIRGGYMRADGYCSAGEPKEGVND